MLEKFKDFDFSIFLIVCVLGAIGASLAYIAGFVGLAQLDENWKFHLALHAPLGALAGTIFIFLIASTDTRHIGRVLTLAALAGFFWQPVIEAGKVYVDRVAEAQATDETKVTAESISDTLEDVRLGKLTEEEGRKRTSEAVEKINYLVPKISDRDLVKRIESNIASVSSTSDFRNTSWVIETVSQELDPKVAEQIWSIPSPTNLNFSKKLEPKGYNYSEAFMKLEEPFGKAPDVQGLDKNPWLQNGWTPDAIKRELNGSTSGMMQNWVAEN